MRIKSSEAIVKVLERENVSHIFSLPGGHIQPIFDAIYDSNLQLISVRHEQAAAHMADAIRERTRQTLRSLPVSERAPVRYSSRGIR